MGTIWVARFPPGAPSALLDGCLRALRSLVAAVWWNSAPSPSPLLCAGSRVAVLLARGGCAAVAGEWLSWWSGMLLEGGGIAC